MIALGVLLAGPATAQSFSCRMGTEPACLDYGAKVCSSQGKCVDSDAACFSSYQCNYEGFTCKSNLTEVIAEHDDLVAKYNELLGTYKDLTNEFDGLLEDARKVAQSHDALKACLLSASTMDDVLTCRGY